MGSLRVFGDFVFFVILGVLVVSVFNLAYVIISILHHGLSYEPHSVGLLDYTWGVGVFLISIISLAFVIYIIFDVIPSYIRKMEGGE